MTAGRKGKFSDFAFLYRMHTQSRVIEDTLVREGIPYKIIGGTRFYERKEIKDVMAYLKLIVNPADNISLKRVINLPKRGIGGTTLDKLEEEAESKNISILELIRTDELEFVPRGKEKLKGFAALMDEFCEISDSNSPSAAIEHIAEKSGIFEEYRKEGEIEAQTRIENIEELKSVAVELEKKNNVTAMDEFLEYTSLITDTDVSEEDADCVVLMTIHAAKGLEFPNVFLTGLEEGIFPKIDMFCENEEELEEERRLFYVAITRAKQRLFIAYARERMLYGKSIYERPSRFLEELPGELLHRESSIPKPPARAKNTADKKTFDFAAAAAKFTSADVRQFKQSSEKFMKGDFVEHKKFGKGKVVSVSESTGMTILGIDFETCGRKSIVSNAVSKINT